MGDPRKQRKKYSTPTHPWQRVRLDEERKLKREYGFRNKKEIWKINSMLRNFRNQAKTIIATRTEQADKERELLLKKLIKYGIVDSSATIDSVLGLTLKDLLERRLQTVVYRKGLAKSMLQARQFIIHEHIKVGDKKITSPGYLVTIADEAVISYSEDSPLTDDLHPERIQEEKVPVKEEAESKETESKDKEEVKAEPKETESKDVKKSDSKKDSKSKKSEEKEEKGKKEAKEVEKDSSEKNQDEKDKKEGSEK